ncbi:MAG: hypothetical protein RJB66_1386 [Pseudomonadota bacterium]|jgi:hypothetical protein
MQNKNSHQNKTRLRGVWKYTLSLCFLGFSIFAFSAEPSSSNSQSKTKSETSRRLTEFEWDPIPKAKSYEIELRPMTKSGEKKDPFRFKVQETRWKGELKPGEYKMRLRSLDRRGVPGEWSAAENFYVKLYAPQVVSPSSNEIITTDENETFDLPLEWLPQSEASIFKVHIEDEGKTFTKDFDVQENKSKVPVPVARRFKWSIIGFDKLGKEGELFGEPILFTVLGKQLDTPTITKPKNAFVRQLEWGPVNYAENYSYELYSRGPGRKWQSVIKEDNVSKTQIPFPQEWKGGEYKLSVSAHGKLRTSSKTKSLIFKVFAGDRSRESEVRNGLRASIERTNEWYGIASYLITQIQYSAINYDKGSTPSFLAIGGTGRLGAGYLERERPWGFLGILDLSGFTIGEKNYTYPSLELHGIFRKASNELGELRVSSGIYYKELPEILGYADTGIFSLSQLSALGAHAGGEYWYSLSEKLGVQFNARVYFPITGKTPTGAKLLPSQSLQVGFLGSLRLNKRATGLMGYAYRDDKIEYKVTNDRALNAGYTVNHSSVVGHYLNFLLEWDF